jgi:hypothetical protein
MKSEVRENETWHFSPDFTLPSFNDLPKKTKSSLIESQGKLKNIHGPLGDWFKKDIDLFNYDNSLALSSFGQCLSHSLSDHFMARGGRQNIDSLRTDLERLSLKKNSFESDFLFCSNADEFIHRLEVLSSLLLSEQSSIRRQGLRFKPDREGHLWVFLPPDIIRIRLRKLFEYLRTNKGSVPDLFLAVVSLIAILFCHPFKDGNGRLSRTVFNLILYSGGMDRAAYIPLKEIWSLSKGGFLIRARLVMTRDDWVPILEFFVYVIDLMSEANVKAKNLQS